MSLIEGLVRVHNAPMAQKVGGAMCTVGLLGSIHRVLQPGILKSEELNSPVPYARINNETSPHRNP